MSLYGNVQETYKVLDVVVKDRFGIGNGEIGPSFFDQHIVPVYAVHRRSLEELFVFLHKNPRNSRYYLAIKQLHEHGYRTDVRSRHLPGLPPLPSIEELIADPV